MRDGFRNHVCIQKLKVPGVIDHAAHEVAGLLVVEIAQVHAFQLVICLGPKVAHQKPRGLVGKIIAHKAEENAEKIEEDEDQRQGADLTEACVIHTPADNAGHGGEDPRGKEVDARQAQGGEDRQNVQPFVADGFFAQFQQHVHGSASDPFSISVL